MHENINLTEIASQFVLGTIRAFELPSLATTLLASGIESESLVQLVITDEQGSEQLNDLFQKALFELGHDLPKPDEAACLLSKPIARSILLGDIPEYEGAMKIWKEIIDHLESVPDELWTFKSVASTIEDYMEFSTYSAELKAQCEDEIRKACIRLTENA